MTKLAKLSEAARSWKPQADDWRAWHIYFGSLSALDRMLFDGLRSEVSRLDSSIDFFFLRYWENGPHLRARFRGMREEEFSALGKRLHHAAETVNATTPVLPNQFPPPAIPAIKHHARTHTIAPGTTVEVLYEPELRRYGGRHGLAINEHLFDASSRLSLAIIEKTIGAFERRTTIGLTLTAAAIRCVASDRDDFASFLRGMKDQWRNFVADPNTYEDQAQRTLASDPASIQSMIADFSNVPSAAQITPVSETWRRILTVHFAELGSLAQGGLLVNPHSGLTVQNADDLKDTLQAIMLSQIHMLNNRLGIFPHQEYLFASILQKALATC